MKNMVKIAIYSAFALGLPTFLGAASTGDEDLKHFRQATISQGSFTNKRLPSVIWMKILNFVGWKYAPEKTMELGTASIQGFKSYGDNGIIVARSKDIQVIDRATGAPCRTITVIPEPTTFANIGAIALLPHNKLAVAVINGTNRTLQIFDITSGELIQKINTGDHIPFDLTPLSGTTLLDIMRN